GDREAGAVVSLVQSLRTEHPEGTIAILVRSRAQLGVIVPRLRDAGLRFRAVEIEQLGERQAIQDVLALTLALNRFADRIAWLAILRAPWCGLTLTDLYHLAGGVNGRTIWQCMQDPDRLQLLSVDGRERLLKMRAVLELHYAEQGRRNLRRSVESVWMSLGGPATLGDRTDLDNVKVYFELLEQFAAGVTLQHEAQFFEGINRLFAAPDVRADEMLQIMTIHKAKGLEFDTVIMPGLEKGRMRDEHTLLRWEEIPHEEGPGLLLAPIREAGELQSPIYDYLKRREEQKHYFEEQRLLYVAVTRAKHRLHLLASVPVKENHDGIELSGPQKGSLLYHLWPQLETDFDAALQEEDHSPLAREVETRQLTNNLNRLAPGWHLPAPPEVISRESPPSVEIPADEATPEFEWAGETIKHIGTVTHRAIQQIAETGIAEWDQERILSNEERYRGALLRLGVVESDLAWAVNNVIKALNNLISDEHGRWILDPAHKGVRNEYAVSGLYRGRVVNAIIDRTFIDSENIRWIIDYKTSRHEGPDVQAFLDREQERYRSQLEKYAILLRHMENIEIRLGLYFPLLCGWREMTPGENTGYSS
ncbi:MAG TPA: 3'-5' exonuclease, partial [Gammaproteobacteria bacterium]|nr:3'-5' exonuclease [Gammaproteobacteria bacterium]